MMQSLGAYSKQKAGEARHDLHLDLNSWSSGRNQLWRLREKGRESERGKFTIFSLRFIEPGEGRNTVPLPTPDIPAA